MTRVARLGLFVLAALIIFAIAVFMVSKRQFLFTDTYRLSADFDTVAGLTAGAEVRLGGVRVGTVSSIQMPRQLGEKVDVIMDLNDATHQLLKEDSVATIRTEGLLGNEFLSISFGSPGAPPIRSGSVIKGAPPIDLSSVVEKANNLLDTTNDTLRRLDAASSNVKEITAKINSGEGTLGALLNDKSMYNRLNKTAAELEQTSEKIGAGTTHVIQKTDRILSTANRTIEHADRTVEDADHAVGNMEAASRNVDVATANIKDITTKINSGEGTLGALVNSRALYQKLNKTTEDIKATAQAAKAGTAAFSEDMEALKHNWFFRGFFKSRGYEDESDLSKYLISRIPARPPSREFLINARDIFKKRDNPRLKNEKRLKTIGQFLQSHPFNLAVVVSYTDMKRGSGQDLKLSEARAYEVRKYIVDNYDLDDTRIKTKGLGKQEVSGARPEDGVEVLVYLSAPEKPVPAKNRLHRGESTLPELSNS